jgi:predicted PolB exonuclease-like 3'-5' exonuclease
MATNYRKQARMFFDIETAANPENLALMPEPKAPGNLKDPVKIEAAISEKKAELIEMAALDADYGRVLSIGYACDLEKEPTVYLVDDQMDEARLISGFWNVFQYCNGYAVGFNILSFDLPYLMARSMYLGVSVPCVPMLAKFRTEPITDLYAIRYNWGPGKGLKQVCKLLKIPNDCPDIDGSKVKDLTPEELRVYQASDVKLTIELYKRMNGVYFSH